MSKISRAQGVFERLEDRILFDAVPDGDFLLNEIDHQALPVGDVEEVTSSDKSSHELIVVDSSVANTDKLIEGILKQNPGQTFQIAFVNSASSGVEQLTDILDQANQKYDAIHLVSHGREGIIEFGGTTLTHANINSFSAQLGQWSSALSDHADFLIYGCDVAANDVGEKLLQSFAALTGADVAASSDLTGSESPGGNWELERSVGTIESLALAIQDWEGSLGGRSEWSSVMNQDFDGDGILDQFDTDDDNDGLADSFERTIWGTIPATDYLTLNGDATLSNPKSPNEIRLTDATNSQRGTAISSARIEITESFVFDFDVFLGNKDGADGITFVLHNDPAGSQAIGAKGYGMGAHGIQDGIAIEFDTYKNRLDRYQDHSSVWDLNSGIANGIEFTTQPDELVEQQDVENLENGKWHNVVVTWDATSNTLAYSLNGVTLTSVEVDLKNEHFGGSNLVHFGWTGSTGGLNNDHLVRVNDFVVSWEEGTLDNGDSDNDGFVDSLDVDSNNDGFADTDQDNLFVIIENSTATIQGFDVNSHTIDTHRFSNESGRPITTDDVTVNSDENGDAVLTIGSNQQLTLVGVDASVVDENYLVLAGFERGEGSSANELPTFDVDGATYQVHSKKGQLVTVDTEAQTLVNATHQAGVKLNAVGLNPTDNYAYGFNQTDKTLVRLGSNGQIQDLGPVSGMPVGEAGSYVGDFGPDGLLYVRPTNDISALYGIDVSTQSVVTQIQLSTNLHRVFDIAWNPLEQKFFTVQRANSFNSSDMLLSVAMDGTVTQIGETGIENSTFGAMYADVTGAVFGISNSTGGVFRFDTTDGSAIKVGQAERAGVNDGFSNPNQEINLAPIANNDRLIADQNSAISGDLFSDNGFGNDWDANEDLFRIISVNGNHESVGQTVVLDSGAILKVDSNGKFNYNPAGAFDHLILGQTNTDVITYSIQDEAGNVSTATSEFVVEAARVTIFDLNLATEEVTNVGDVNGNGSDDFLVSIPEWDSGTGVTFLIYGSSTGLDLEFDVNNLLAANGGDGSQGTIFYGIDSNDLSGGALSRAGDINGDQLADFVIGASDADRDSIKNSGETYLMLGQSQGFGAEFHLANLHWENGGDGTHGMVIRGVNQHDLTGGSIAALGDVNNDGLDDIGIAAVHADVDGRVNAGQTYVVYGQNHLSHELDLQKLQDGHSDAGFAINGMQKHDLAGSNIQVADVNRDGINDILLSAKYADSHGLVDTGQSYVVYGSSSRFENVELGNLLVANGGDGGEGVVFNGTARSSGDGASVRFINDFNRDGKVDFEAVVEQEDGSIRKHQFASSEIITPEVELTDAMTAEVKLDFFSTSQELDQRHWDTLPKSVTLHSSAGSALTIWGDRQVIAMIDGTCDWYDIGYGPGSIQLKSGAVISWDSTSANVTEDGTSPLTKFVVAYDGLEETVNLNGDNQVNQITDLSESDLRNFIRELRHFAGDNEAPLIYSA